MSAISGPDQSDVNSALAKSDMDAVLKVAYAARSQYVHQLQRLPGMISVAHEHSDTVFIDRVPHLTLQGLSRLMRAVIVEFVMRQPTLEREPYDYSAERSGVVYLPLAPQYWIGNVGSNLSEVGRDKLEGFLSQLATISIDEPNAAITDMRPVLFEVSKTLSGFSKKQRLPYLALYLIYNGSVHPELRVSTTEKFDFHIREDFSSPSLELIISHVALGCGGLNVPLECYREIVDRYFQRRNSTTGLRFPRIFESAMVLDLAERYRQATDIDNCKRMVALAVENNPGHNGLLQLESTLSVEGAIRYEEILFAMQSPDGE